MSERHAVAYRVTSEVDPTSGAPFAVDCGEHEAIVAAAGAVLGTLLLQTGALVAHRVATPDRTVFAPPPPAWVRAVFQTVTGASADTVRCGVSVSDNVPHASWYDYDGVTFDSIFADAVVEEVARLALGGPPSALLISDGNGHLCWAPAGAQVYAAPSPAAVLQGACRFCGRTGNDQVGGSPVFFEPAPAEGLVCQHGSCRSRAVSAARRLGVDPLPLTDRRGRLAPAALEHLFPERQAAQTEVSRG